MNLFVKRAYDDDHFEEVIICDESGTKLKSCPECGDAEFLVIDSSYHAGCSWVECDCGHHFQSKCREENIGRYWNKHCKEVIDQKGGA